MLTEVCHGLSQSFYLNITWNLCAFHCLNISISSCCVVLRCDSLIKDTLNKQTSSCIVGTIHSPVWKKNIKMLWTYFNPIHFWWSFCRLVNYSRMNQHSVWGCYVIIMLMLEVCYLFFIYALYWHFQIIIVTHSKGQGHLWEADCLTTHHIPCPLQNIKDSLLVSALCLNVWWCRERKLKYLYVIHPVVLLYVNQ